jgi:hypothetical protein
VLFPTQALVTVGDRAVLRLLVRRFRAAGRNTRYVVIVGAGERGQEFADRLEANLWLGLRVAGFLDNDADAAAGLPENRPWLGPLDRFGTLLRETVVDEVAVCIPVGTWDERVTELIRSATSPTWTAGRSCSTCGSWPVRCRWCWRGQGGRVSTQGDHSVGRTTGTEAGRHILKRDCPVVCRGRRRRAIRPITSVNA